MTHELKTPISTIALSSEVLTDPNIINEPERIRSYANIIRTENERLRTQVERVLQLSTLDKGELELKREAVDLHKVVNEVTSAFTVQLNERKGEMTTDLKATRAIVEGDHVHLTNAVINLVDNAVKYSLNEPKITIRSSNHGGYIKLEVMDKGNLEYLEFDDMLADLRRIDGGAHHG